MSFYFLETTAFAKLFVRESGTNALIQLMESLEDNKKLICAVTPLEVFAAIKKRERSGKIALQAATAALESLRLESARMVQQPVNPGVLDAARQLLERTDLRWPDALQVGAALAARDMFPGTEIIFVTALPHLVDAAKSEGLKAMDPASLPETNRGSQDVKANSSSEAELAQVTE